MTDFNYSTSNITDDMLKESVANVDKYWSDKIEKDLLEKLAAIPKHSQLYLVAVPPAYEQLKMHVEPLDYPETPYRSMMPFNYAPLYRMPIITLWDTCDTSLPYVKPVVWKEEPVVEAVPVWQYWVAAAVFAVVLCLAGGVV
jgi:hypothetical protein